MKIVDEIVEELLESLSVYRYIQDINGEELDAASEVAACAALIAAKLEPVKRIVQELEWCIEENIGGEDYASCPECGGLKWRDHKIDCPLEAAVALFKEE